MSINFMILSKLRQALVAVGLISILLTGCASAPAVRVSDAEGVEPVSALGMSCKKPFALRKDCSGWSGPTKRISIDGNKLKVAANADNTVTVMFSKNNAKATQASNLGYELMKKELVTRGFTIVKVTPIESSGLMFGYAIQTDKPAYQIWNEFVIEK